jgi:hypothetical protein
MLIYITGAFFKKIHHKFAGQEITVHGPRVYPGNYTVYSAHCLKRLKHGNHVSMLRT